MRVDLLGVVEDGATRGADVPTDPRATIRMPRGGALTIGVRVVTASGVPVALAGGTLVLTVKRSTLQGRPPPGLLKTAELDRARGAAFFTVAPTDTRRLEPGAYVYDVWWTDGDGARAQVVPTSAFLLLPGVG